MVTFALKKILGVFLLLFGIFALVTPFTPGAWLIFVGIELLGLTFLLPRPIRTRWEAFKKLLLSKWHAFRAKRTAKNPSRDLE